MKNLGRFILIAIFVVPIIICVMVLKSIWSEEDETGDNKVSGDTDNSVLVSVSDPIYESGNQLISGDEIVLPASGEIRQMGGESFETKIGDPISTVYTDATISSVLANVYLEALESSDVVGKLEKHTTVIAQKFPGGWSRVSGTDASGIKVSGWTKTDNVSFVEDSTTTLITTPGGSTGVVTAEPYLNVRLNPTTSATILTKVDKGATVTIQESVNGWHKITVNGVTGWVSAAYIKSN